MKKNSIFASKRVIFVFALLLAFISWIVIAGFINPGDEKLITYVSIDYERTAQDYIDKNLQPVGSFDDAFADVMVQGDGSVTGGLNDKSVAVYADYSGVNGPGTYEVPLRTEKVAAGTYNITDVSVHNAEHSLDKDPKETVSLTFEEVAEKKFDVTVKADGVTAAPGFFKDPPTADPSSVRIYGPKSKVDLVAQVVAQLNVEEELDATKEYTAGTELLLLDKTGAALDKDALGVTLDPAVVTIKVPILESKTVGLTATFIDLPQGFDAEWFSGLIRLTADQLQVVGPAVELDRLADPFPVYTYDIRDIDLGWESDPVTIELPEGLRNIDQLRQVVVSVDTTGFVEKNFEVPEKNFQVVGAPQGTTVSPVDDVINVRLIGPEDQMISLLPENISIQLDASGLAATARGQHAVPVRISIPGANRLIPVGEYSVVCDVTIEN